MKLTKVYDFFGGFAECLTVVSLAAAITAMFLGKLSGSFAYTLTAIQGFAVVHDQLTSYQDAKIQKQTASSGDHGITLSARQ